MKALTTFWWRRLVLFILTYRSANRFLNVQVLVHKKNPSVFHLALQKQQVANTRTSAAKIANELLRTKGILLRAPDGALYHRKVKNAEQFFHPAAFLHASMRSPNVMYRPSEHHFAAVGLLIGTKFKRHVPPEFNATVTDHVSCRAYYPKDSSSSSRNHSLLNILGTSCRPFLQDNDFFVDVQGGSISLYNRTNGCSCNTDAFSGKDYALYYVKVKSECWYEDTSAGIKELILASNSLFLNRKILPARPRARRFSRGVGFDNITYYQGWTECSATPSIDNVGIADAVVIELPHVKKTEGRTPVTLDLEKEALEDLKRKLQHYEHLHLPVLFLEEKIGMEEKECIFFWGGEQCQIGYKKEFAAHTFVFQDGSNLSRDDEGNDVYFFSN